jgi:ankyrin repeat protein
VRNRVGETPLMMAALKAEVEAARALVAHGAAVQKDGWSPLHYAATGGSAAIVKLLLSKGAALEARSPNGTTPLMMAARYGNEEAVDALLAAGADRTLKNDLGMDASAFAASAGREKLAARLKPPATAK